MPLHVYSLLSLSSNFQIVTQFIRYNLMAFNIIIFAAGYQLEVLLFSYGFILCCPIRRWSMIIRAWLYVIYAHKRVITRTCIYVFSTESLLELST